MSATIPRHLPASAFPMKDLGLEPTQEALRLYIAAFFVSESPVWYQVISIFSMAFISIQITIALALLLRRVCEGSVWLFRVEGGAIIPNTLISFAVFAAMYGAALVVWLGIQFPILQTETVSPSTIPYFELLIWWPLLLGAWCADWGTLRAIPRDVVSSDSDSITKRRWTLSKSNTVFFGVPVLFAIPTIATAIPAFREWTKCVDAWKAFDRAMLTMNANPSHLATPEQVAWGISIWQEYMSALYLMCVCMWAWGAFAIFNLVLFAVLGGILILSLRDHIDRTESHSGRTQLTMELADDEARREQQFFPPLKVLPTKPKSREEELKQAVRNVQLQYIAIQSVTLVCAAVAIANAATIQERAAKGPEHYFFIYRASWAAISLITSIGAIFVLFAVFNRELGEPVIFHWRKIPNRAPGTFVSHDSTAVGSQDRSPIKTQLARFPRWSLPPQTKSTEPASPGQRSGLMFSMPIAPHVAENGIELGNVGRPEGMSSETWDIVASAARNHVLSKPGRGSEDADAPLDTGAAYSFSTSEGAGLCDNAMDTPHMDIGLHRSDGIVEDGEVDAIPDPYANSHVHFP